MPNSQSITIHHAIPADLDALVALEQATFTADRIARRQWRRHIGSRSACVLVAGKPGQVDAVAVVFYRSGSKCARLYSLAVRAERQGEGLASALLARAEADARRRGCRSMRLEVRSDNAAAIGLYEHHGYARSTRLAGYYEDGADGWRYQKTLVPARA